MAPIRTTSPRTSNAAISPALPKGMISSRCLSFTARRGLAARVRRELQQSECAVDRVSEAPHDVEVRCRAGEFTFDGEILDSQQVGGGLIGEDDAVDGHCPALALPAASR